MEQAVVKVLYQEDATDHEERGTHFAFPTIWLERWSAPGEHRIHYIVTYGERSRALQWLGQGPHIARLDARTDSEAIRTAIAIYDDLVEDWLREGT